MDTKQFCGRFRGSGTWRDSVGNTGIYDVVQTHRVDDNQYQIDQRHIHGGVPGDLTVTLTAMAPHVYRVEAVDQAGIYGAATRNSAGNYIMWSEESQRVSDAEEIYND